MTMHMQASKETFHQIIHLTPPMTDAITMISILTYPGNHQSGISSHLGLWPMPCPGQECNKFRLNSLAFYCA